MTKRILIIDDDKDMLEMLSIVFQNSDFEVVLSTTGMGYTQIQLLKPDLILLDVNIQGYETTGDLICKEIKEHPGTEHLPVILISGEYNLASIAEHCHADAYFSKPFDINLLKIKVTSKLM